MSALADFRLIDTSKLNDLLEHAEIKIEKSFLSKKVVDNYWNYLNTNAKKLSDFKGSGYIFANLLIFLKEKKGINLLDSPYNEIVNSIAARRKNTTLIFTFDQKTACLEKLNADQFTIEELIEFNTEFSEEDDPELAKAEIEGVKALQENLGLLTDDRQVLLLTVG
jgi:hypothetical protein